MFKNPLICSLTTERWCVLLQLINNSKHTGNGEVRNLKVIRFKDFSSFSGEYRNGYEWKKNGKLFPILRISYRHTCKHFYFAYILTLNCCNGLIASVGNSSILLFRSESELRVPLRPVNARGSTELTRFRSRVNAVNWRRF